MHKITEVLVLPQKKINKILFLRKIWTTTTITIKDVSIYNNTIKQSIKFAHIFFDFFFVSLTSQFENEETRNFNFTRIDPL